MTKTVYAAKVSGWGPGFDKRSFENLDPLDEVIVLLYVGPDLPRLDLSLASTGKI